MDSFEIHYPSIELSPYIKNYWFLTAHAANEEQGIIPTGNINLIFHRGSPLILGDKSQPQAFVCGQTTTHSTLIQTGVTDMICVVFQPYGARIFFDQPMHELKGLNVEADLLNIPRLSELHEILQNTGDNRECVRRIEDFLRKRFNQTKEYTVKRVVAAVNAVDRGCMDTTRLADIACLSHRQFNRVFSDYVGLNPKEFARVIRFQRALYTMQNRSSISLTELAYSCEFYDQSHLINEFKFFSGYTPKEYIAVCAPYSDYFSL